MKDGSVWEMRVGVPRLPVYAKLERFYFFLYHFHPFLYTPSTLNP